MFTILHFSPTGNAAYLAKRMGQCVKTDRIYAIEHTDPESSDVGEHLVIFFAIHGFNAPRTVLRFVKKMKASQFKDISLIGVGCNDLWLNYGASREIRKILSNKAYPIVVDEIIAMPLTFVMSFPEKIIYKQLEDATSALEYFASNMIQNKVSRRKIPFKSLAISKIGKIESYAARFFGLELHAKKVCNQCGVCVRDCPEKNISQKANGKLRFGFNCMMCMRCIYNCPQKAIVPRFSKFIPIKNGYSILRYLDK